MFQTFKLSFDVDILAFWLFLLEWTFFHSSVANVIKLFTAVSYENFLNKLECSSLKSLSRISIMFVGKAGAYPSEAPFSCYTHGQAPGLTRKHQTRPERPAGDKHSGLLRKVVTYGRKKFYNIGHWSHCKAVTSPTPDIAQLVLSHFLLQRN